MSDLTLHPVRKCQGEITIPGDKSISHRSIMFGAISNGITEATHFLESADCLSTISCFRQMGIDIEYIPQSGHVTIHGSGMHGLKAPASDLDTGNSGTTTRLIAGILSAQPFCVTLNGDASIQKRPMKRIMEPLSLMGADISSIKGNGCAPLAIRGQHLHGISYSSPVASAQVKSSILLAGLYADSPTYVTEPAISRNHSEIMLESFGAQIRTDGLTCSVQPASELFGQQICVPGDISSAAYFIAAALLLPNSELLLKNVGINPTRDGILRVAKEMGADITLQNIRNTGEPSADLLVRSSSLHATTIEGDLIPTLIDEIPMIAVLAAFADGTTVIRDAAELKVKESDRITVMTQNLKAMGCDITATDDGMIIRGGNPLHGAQIESHLDHRIAMSFAIASLLADGPTTIHQAECVAISYPDFFRTLQTITSVQ